MKLPLVEQRYQAVLTEEPALAFCVRDVRKGIFPILQLLTLMV